MTALAAKQGLDAEAAMAEYRQKADTKVAATARKALRELTQQRGSIVIDLMPGLQTWIENNGIPA